MGLFDKLESKLEQGVNGAFARAFKSEVQPVEIASGIRRAMDDRAASVGRGKRPIVPNLFTIELSPTDYERLCAWGDELDDELIASAQEHADEQRYLPGGPLTIVLAESDTLETGVFRLRPATAKAADAIAHQRQHPRLTPEDTGRSPHDAWDDAGQSHDGAYAESGHRDSGYSDDFDGPRGAEPDGASARRAGASAAGAPSSAGTFGAGSRGTTPSATAPGQGTGRPFSARIKDYLMGGYADDASLEAHTGRQAAGPADARGTQANPGNPHDDAWDDADGYDEHDADLAYEAGGYDDGHSASGYGHHRGTAGDHAASTPDAGHDEYASEAPGDRDEYDGSFSEHASGRSGFDDGEPSRFRDDDRHDRSSATSAPARARGAVSPGTTSARPATPTASAHTSRQARQAHAWDDDDSDYGDPTGYEPAPAAAPNRPRAMTPRERPWLKIEGQRYPLLGAITVLGRDDDADIVVDDPGVSRRHSEIRITHDGPHLVMSVRDLGSTNGTYVNGDLIDSAHVHDGDRLTLGRTPMTIHLGDRP